MENITENTTETMEKKISEDAGGKKKDSPKGRGPWIWLLIILWGAAIVCLVIFAIGKYREYKAEKKYEMLAAQTELTVDEETPKAILEQIADEIETETPEPTPEPTPDPMQVCRSRIKRSILKRSRRRQTRISMPGSIFRIPI